MITRNTAPSGAGMLDDHALRQNMAETLYSLIPMDRIEGAGEQRYVQRCGGPPVEIFDGEQEYVTLTIPQPQAIIKK